MSELVKAPEYNMMVSMADQIAHTSFVPNSYRGKPDEILACVLAGRELGIGPMQSLSHINIVQGRPAPSAELMGALIRQRGHTLYATEHTDQTCTIMGKRADNGDEDTFTYTMDMARRAGLANKSNWKQYPEAMLWSRALSALARKLFQDCLSGFSLTPEELGSEEPVGTRDLRDLSDYDRTPIDAPEEPIAELQPQPERQDFPEAIVADKPAAVFPVPGGDQPEDEGDWFGWAINEYKKVHDSDRDPWAAALEATGFHNDDLKEKDNAITFVSTVKQAANVDAWKLAPSAGYRQWATGWAMRWFANDAANELEEALTVLELEKIGGKRQAEEVVAVMREKFVERGEQETLG